MNQVALQGSVLELKPLRYTPAGLPALELTLEHESSVTEAGHPRQVNFVVSVVALGENALLLADTPLGATLTIEGFLAASRKGSTRLVLHVQHCRRLFAGQASATV